MSADSDARRERVAAFDRSDYGAVFASARGEVLRELGFAVRPCSTPLSVEHRITRVAARADGAYRSLVEVQQSFFDDDERVRQTAREGAHRVLRQAYTGDQHERAWTEFTSRNMFDRTVQRALQVKDPDGPEPWWARQRNQLIVRTTAIGAMFVVAVFAAIAVALDHPAVAVPLLFVAAAIDITEGAFARSVHMRDAGLRWMSCVASHAADLVLMGGVALAAAADSDALASGAVLGAMLATLFGSFVRVSALQAGYRFWRSRSERYARYSGFLAYLAAATAGHRSLGIAVLTSACLASGLAECWRVVHGVLRMPSVQGGGVVFVDTEDILQAWPLADDSPAELSGEAPVRWDRRPARGSHRMGHRTAASSRRR